MEHATTLSRESLEQALDALLETSSQRPVLSRRYAYIVKVDGTLLYVSEDQLFRVLEQAEERNENRGGLPCMEERC